MADIKANYSDEKLEAQTSRVEQVEDHGAINEKRLVRKIDYRLIPWLSLLYLLSFLDRTNIGNAAIFGLRTDLKLTLSQYSACLAVFFAFYVMFEVPSNAVMKMWRPSMWLSLIMVAWGVVMLAMGFVKDYHGLFIARIFLGITEAGLFPGVSFFLTQWYRRHEINTRIAIFFSAATAAGAFGGLLARLIQLMDGIGGLEGWRYIFILEGAATILVAFASFFMLYDYPNTAKFLSAEEKQFVQARLHHDSDGLSNGHDKRFIKDALLDWKIWTTALIFLGALMPVYSFSLFSPTLINNLGYTAATAQLLSVPPYVLAAITTCSAGILSDRYKKRGVFILGFASVGMLGFLMCICTPNPTVGYVGVFFGAAGIYPLIPLVISWGANNIGGSYKRAVGTALIVGTGNTGGIIASFAYRIQEKPRFFTGHGTVLGFIGMCIILTAVMLVYYNRQNAKRAQLLAERGHAWTAEEKAQYENEGDNAPFFVYTI